MGTFCTDSLSINLFHLRLSLIHNCVDTSELNWSSESSLWSFMIHVAYGFLPFEINPCTPHAFWHLLELKEKKKHFSDSCKLLSLLIFLKYWYFSTLPFTKVLFGLIVQEWLLFQMMFQRLIVCLHFTAVVFWQMKCDIFRSENKKTGQILTRCFRSILTTGDRFFKRISKQIVLLLVRCL